MPKFVMVDLETLGTVPGCSILSIGAVEVDLARLRLGAEFYGVVGRQSCADAFLREEPGTLKWWEDKSPEARVVLDHASDVDMHKPLKEALLNFNSYLLSVTNLRDMRLLGNGADFDNPILRVAYDAAGVEFMNAKPGAGFFGGRCYRTLKGLDEIFGPRFAAPKLARQGAHHHALDDAKSQAEHLLAIVRQIRGA
jgi:hypothetical protein